MRPLPLMARQRTFDVSTTTPEKHLAFVHSPKASRWRSSRCSSSNRTFLNVTVPSERTEGSPSGIAEFLHGRRDTTANDGPAFRRVHLELFVPVDDRARFQKDGSHPSLSQHDELIVAIDTGFLVQQRVLVPTHDGLGILLGILQALGLHFPADQFGEQQARLEVRIAAGDEHGIAAEAIAEMAFLALEFPVLEKFVGHGVMVDRQEEIRLQIVGGSDTLEEAGPGLALGHEQPGLGKACGLQFLLDPLRKAPIEDERPQGGKLYSVGLWRGDVPWRFAVL